MRNLGIACLWAAALAACGCSPCSEEDRRLTLAETQSAARAPLGGARWLSAQQMADELRNDPNAFLLCVATKEEYDRGYIAGSVLIPVAALSWAIDKNELFPEINRGRIPRKDQKILVYCWWKSCECPAIPTYSDLAKKILQEKEFQKVGILDGGMKTWVQAGLPVQKKP